MYQEITIVGNVGKEPEMRYQPDGTAVTNFSVAANKNWRDAAGVDHQQTTWFRVSTWGKMAETMNQYLKAGSLVLVTGELQSDPKTGGPRTYPRKDNTVGASFEVKAMTVKFLSSKNEGSNGNGKVVSIAGKDEDDTIPY